MTDSRKTKAPAATGAIEKTIPTRTNQEEMMTSSVPQPSGNFSTRFEIATGNARICIESDRDYWQDATVPNRVRLTDDCDAHLLLSPEEALSVAAALQASAVHLLEAEPREIRRSTEPGQPEQDGIGGGL